MDINLSVFDLVIGASFVVQVVLVILVLMSIYSWTVIISKKTMLKSAINDINIFHKNFTINMESNLEDLAPKILDTERKKSLMTSIFSVGYNEFNYSKSASNETLIMNSERSYYAMNTAVNNEVDKLGSDLSVLAIVASASPYIGLFGTVWGIMNSFIGLASVKQATIAVVAPGIAEALVATAVGLFAAIPATIAYNSLAAQVELVNSEYTSFVEKLFVVFQRQ